MMKAACTLFLPSPLRIARIVWHMIPFVRRGLHCLLRRRIKVELLDALSISISACRGDFGTAGAVMFLLELGELLEEWTRKKSVEDLARCMSLNVDRVWLRTSEGEVLIPISQVQPGDAVVVRAGGIIPVDGVVLEGEITVNQASLTGESIPVPKRPGGAVYAGTVVEEGECVLEVKKASGQSRYDQIVHMIEQSEQMKSAAESKAAHLADKLHTFPQRLLRRISFLSCPILIEREKREQKKKRERHPRPKPKAALPLCYGKVFKTASLSPLKSEGEAHMGKS